LGFFFLSSVCIFFTNFVHGVPPRLPPIMALRVFLRPALRDPLRPALRVAICILLSSTKIFAQV
jgi:hypothetical protein